MSRSALIGSTVAHAFAIWALFVFVAPGHIKSPPATIQVALVNLPPGAFRPAQGAPVETPPNKDDTPDVKRPVDTMPPEKNAIRPPDAKKPEPQRPAPGLPGGVKTPTAAVGAPGLSGDVAVDDGDFEFTLYLLTVRNRIARAGERRRESSPAGSLCAVRCSFASTGSAGSAT